MNTWTVATGALLVVGALPALVLGATGSDLQRLIGLELTSAVAVLALLALAQASGQPDYLIVPLALAVLSFAGTLVFARLLGPHP